MSSYLSLPSIPMPILFSKIASQFPLIEYAPAPPLHPLPTLPTLWLLGSPTQNEANEPMSRSLIALARFKGVAVLVKWFESELSGLNGNLPNIHLVNGDLIGLEESYQFLLSGTVESEMEGIESISEEVKLLRIGFLKLVKLQLLPYLNTQLLLFQQLQIPKTQSILANWIQSINSLSRRNQIVEKIQFNSGGKNGKLDLDLLLSTAIDCLETLEQKITEDGPENWFDKNQIPTEMDALLYSLLSLLSEFDNKDELKRKLLKCPALLAWLERRKPAI